MDGGSVAQKLELTHDVIERVGQLREKCGRTPRMKRIYCSPLGLMVGHLRNVLEAEGIRCLVRNEFLAGGAGEIPPSECWPELWVERPIDYERAEKLIQETLAATEPRGEPWICPHCGETLEPQFESCWSCGESRPPVGAQR